jgi:hypothetical protein
MIGETVSHYRVLALAALPVLVVVAPAMWALVGNGTLLAIVTVVGVGLIAGHALGGPDAHDRVAVDVVVTDAATSVDEDLALAAELQQVRAGQVIGTEDLILPVADQRGQVRIACCCQPSRSQHDQKRAHNAQHNSGDQPLGACGWNPDGHDTHDGGMRKTRPRRKSDDAAMRGWVACCQQQENPERHINT